MVDREQAITRELLETIDNQPHVTQRSLASELGIALGLANSYLKRCTKKGLVKVRQASAKRYIYDLTPRGFAEKSRLTAEYLSSSLSFYRAAGDAYATIFKRLEPTSARIVFAGVSELTEIAYLKAQHHNIEPIAVWDPRSESRSFLRLPVWISAENIPTGATCVLTELSDPSTTFKILAATIETDRIRIPVVLNPSIRTPTD